jgi:hypothetical protein
VNFEPEKIDRETLAHILQRASFATAPDFVVWGRLPFVGRTSLVRVGALGIFAIAAFARSCVHVIGRSESTKDPGTPLPDQAVLRQISYSEIKSVGLTTAGGLGGVLTIGLGENAGILQVALGGGNVMLSLSKEQYQGQQESIQALKDRANSGATGSQQIEPIASSDITGQLAELTKLWSSGALQDHEFEAAKKIILEQ